MLSTRSGFCAFLIVVIYCISLTSCRQVKADKHRIENLQKLAAICIESTNIHTTADLVGAVQSRGIKLHAVASKDPSMPNYYLVREYLEPVPKAEKIVETGVELMAVE